MRAPGGLPICVISSCYDPEDLGGVGVLVREERKGLLRMGFPVHMIGAGAATPGETGTTRVTGPKKLFPWAAALAYLKTRRRHRFGIVHAHEFSGAWVALIVRIERALTGRGPRIVTTMQCSFLRESRFLRAYRGGGLTLREQIDKWIDFPFRYLEGVMGARLSDRLVAVSRDGCRQISTDYATRAQRVPNGVDPDRFGPGVDGTAFRRDLGLEDAQLILFAGRFVGRKGVEYLLEAFARLAPRHPKAHLLLVGRGRRDYSSQIRRLRISDRARILREVPHERMPEIYAAADIFCLPSLYEGLPLAILEAMAAGKPVVSTRTDGIPEAIRQGETGILVPAGRVDPLCLALDLLLRSPSLRKRLGEAARRAVVSEYSWDRVVRDYGNLFQSMNHTRSQATR
ncbi:MAG: glycosyltransferase family 4 protein [Planctomycetota bacterium]|nr:glycosyltransferase family 4 protein [Planctomycetota bacterium]